MDPLYIAAMTLVLTVFGTTVGTTWRVSRIVNKYDATLIRLMNDHELADTRRFAAVQASIIEMGDTVRHEYGETTAAIRQKIYEVEMYGRDNFVNKGDLEDKLKARIASA